MTPEQTLDWLAEQHKSQCNEDRPVQEWIRSMKSMLPAPVQDVPETNFGNMTKDKALEALESMAHGQDLYELEERAITAIKQALAAPTVQERVAWDRPIIYTPPHMAPPAAQRQWVGLTKEETEWCTAYRHLIEWANDKLKEKNT
jgi:hypothetical protein